MQSRALLLASLVAGASLAGCFGGSDDAPLATAGNETFEPDLDSPDGRRRSVAFEETNVTEEGVGGLEHHHDYWAGRDRVLIFEQPAKMRPMAARNAATYEAAATFRPDLRLDAPALIYERTATVEFTITTPERHACEGEDTVNGDYVCTDNFLGVPRVADPTGGPDGLELRYKHASTDEWIDVGPIAWEAPAIISITDPIQTDMPHATASLWQFQVVSPHKEDQTLTFVAKAEILRATGDVPLWPGHPEFYPDGKTTRVVLEKTGAVAGDPGMYGHGAAIVPQEAGPLPPDKLISYGTRTLYVWLNITDVQAPDPATAPNSWFVFHPNATGRENFTDPYDTTVHGFAVKEHAWVLHVDDAGMDSPYADSSRWRFMLGGSLSAVAISCYADCANWAATYDIVVHASSVELGSEEYSA